MTREAIESVIQAATPDELQAALARRFKMRTAPMSDGTVRAMIYFPPAVKPGDRKRQARHRGGVSLDDPRLD